MKLAQCSLALARSTTERDGLYVFFFFFFFYHLYCIHQVPIDERPGATVQYSAVQVQARGDSCHCMPPAHAACTRLHYTSRRVGGRVPPAQPSPAIDEN
jgi:hypothetical protein